MNLQSIGEFHCDVCFELFGENLRCPRILTCGHSFCHTCLESILIQSPTGSTCPTCKQGIQFQNVASIPINYTVKSLVSRLFIEETLEERKLEISQEVEAEIEAQKIQNETIDESLKDLEAKVLSLELLKSERNKHCEEVKALETSVMSSNSNDQFMEATRKLKDFLEQSRRRMEDLTIQPRSSYGNLTLEALRGWCQVGSVYASHCENGTNLFGQVKLVGNRVWVHCFKSQSPRFQDKIVSFDELLTTFNGSSELPKRGFIQVEDATLGLKDVVIATDSLTPRAMNFLFLCSGIKGRSYEAAELESGGWWIATPSHLGEAVVEGITDGGVYEASMKKGSVYGEWVEDTVWLSGFFIRMKDDPSWKLTTKFGFVEEGLDFLEGIKEGSRVLIKHCGLVI